MNHYESPLPLHKEVVHRLEKLFMCDVTSRYALLYRFNLKHELIAGLDLTAAPSTCARELMDALKRRSLNSDSHILSAIMMAPLPKGIPEE